MYEAFLIATKMPNVELVSCLGLAGGVHPSQRDIRGKRMADLIKAKVYNEDLIYNGPYYKDYKIEGNKIRISFQAKTNRGLKITGGNHLMGFSIAGENGIFKWADAEIDGSEVLVWNSSINNPKHVRYGWAGAMNCANLSNESNMQAYPFRTDAPVMPEDPASILSGKQKTDSGNSFLCKTFFNLKRNYAIYSLDGKCVADNLAGNDLKNAGYQKILPLGLYIIVQENKSSLFKVIR
ncbi:MAG: hypothetical protein GF350_13620 [Chitinivibrionales bacterium]|nr:hypothetical protein [Chitinivibrionales bacterium]